jgi:hypothetical protein
MEVSRRYRARLSATLVADLPLGATLADGAAKVHAAAVPMNDAATAAPACSERPDGPTFSGRSIVLSALVHLIACAHESW